MTAVAKVNVAKWAAYMRSPQWGELILHVIMSSR